MEASHHLILLGSALVLLSIFAGVFSARFGTPLLLVFLGLGILAGEEGSGGILFRDFHAAYLIGSVALAIILFDGGLRTDRSDVRRALWPSLALATIGVIVTAAIVGAMAVLLFSTSWVRGLLIGAIVAPTDAAAVSALLHLRRLELRARVAAILEIESGLNDPSSVLLAVLLVNLLVAPAPLSGFHIVALLAQEIVGGAAFGIGGGYLLLALVNRLEGTSGLYPILALAGGTALFGAAQTAGASGFLAAYLAGLILGSHRQRATQVINQAFDAFAWLSQIVLFLILGLLVKPSALVPILGPSLVVAAVLMLVARPIAVALCLLPFRYTGSEIAFISWVGLRGAVPIFLAIIPVLAGLPDAAMFFGVAFIVVLISLILQGWTVAAAGRMFDLDVPPLQQASRLDIDLPGRLGDENTVAGYRVEARCRAASKSVEALPLPPTASVLVVIRDGIASSAASAAPLAPGDYVLALARPEDLALLDRVFGPRPERSRADERGLLGEFAFDGTTTLAVIANLYDPAAAAGESVTLAEFLADRFGGTPAVGDRTRFGAVELIVRDMQGDTITQVGVELEPTPVHPWRFWLQRLPPIAGWFRSARQAVSASRGRPR
ncbi:MAG: potassium/proton antiporter [Alphaproteobacteria bacterium]|nr:potassium/proton antiporter [Alphaproteobacteria bacterium]